MVTRFQSGRVSFALITSPKGRRDWELPIDAIQPDPSLWSKRDNKQGRGGKHLTADLAPHRKPAQRWEAPKAHYSDKRRKR